MDIEQALERYSFQLHADGRSLHTVAQARRHVRLFARWIGKRAIADVSHEDVAAFLASDLVTRRADGNARRPSSANALRSSLRCFFTYAHSAGLAPVNAGRLVRRAMCGKSQPRAIGEEECARLLAALEKAS